MSRSPHGLVPSKKNEEASVLNNNFRIADSAPGPQMNLVLFSTPPARNTCLSLPDPPARIMKEIWHSGARVPDEPALHT